MQHPAWPQTAPPPPAGSAGPPTGPPGSVPPHHYPPHHPQQQGYYPPPTQDGRVTSSGKSEAHPQHGYSHGAPPPPQGYGGYPPHPSQGQQPPPPGYYGSQHPPHGQQQWGMHPSYGGAPPPPHSSNGSAWEQSHHQPQHSTTQSRHPESSSHPPEAQGYHPSSSHHGQHPHYSRHGPPPPEAQVPHSNGAPRASYRPPPSQPSSQSPQHSQSSRNSHHSAPAPQPRADHSAPPPQDSNSNRKAPLPTSAPRMPPDHEASSILPSQSSQQPGPHGYPPHSSNRGPPPPPPSHHTPNIHPSFSTASNHTSNTVTTTPKATQPPHTPGALSMAASTATANTEDDKGRGSYKCGRCGVPKKGHVCPYQPKVKRRPDEPVPEMKCVSTQVEMDEFMTLRRLNIEIQGYPESYAAEPMDMVGAEIGQHQPSSMGAIANPAHPSMESGSDARAAPGSGSHHAGPPTSLPSLTSMQSQPAPGAAPPAKVVSSSSEPAANGPLVTAGENSKVEGGESNNVAESTETAIWQSSPNEIATQTKSNVDETLAQPDPATTETKSGTAASSSPPVNKEMKESTTDTEPTADTSIKNGDESQLEATTTEKSDTMSPVKNEEAETTAGALPPEQLSESKKRDAEKISTSEGVEASTVQQEEDSNKKSRYEQDEK